MAGKSEKNEIYNIPMDALMPIIRESLAAGKSVRFMPKGTSMLPMLRQGIDSVVISPVQGNLKRFDLPLYQRANGQYVLHRVVDVREVSRTASENGDTDLISYTCMGDNQFVREPGIKQDQVIAVVTEFYRGKRAYKTDNPGYKLYCKVWYHSRRLRHFVRRGINWLKRRWRTFCEKE